MTKFVERYFPWGFFFAALVIFLWELWSREILMIDSRFALFVYEMGESGIAPFPRLNGQLYPDYTSLPTLLMYLSSRLFGTVNWFTIVFPSAVVGAALVAATGMLGARLRSPKYGISAALLMLGAYEFVSIGRIVSIDLFPALASLLGFWVVFRYGEEGNRKLLWWLPLFFTVGFLARGPIGVVIPTAVVLSALAIYGRFRAFFAVGFGAAAIMLFFLGLWAWFAFTWGGAEFHRDFWEMQIFDRIGSTRPVWYYFADAVGSFTFTYPLALVVTVIYLFYWKREFFRFAGEDAARRELQLLNGWMFIVLVGMSIPGTKHLRYIAPVIPAAALLAALAIENPDQIPALAVLRRWIFRIGGVLVCLAPPAYLIAALVLCDRRVVELIGSEIRLELLLPLFLLLAGAVSFWVDVRRRGRGGAVQLASLVLLVVVMRVFVMEAVNQATVSSREFTLVCEKLRPAGQPLYFWGLGPDGDDNKYLLHVERDRIFIPRTFKKKDFPEMAALPPGTLLLAREERWEEEVPESLRCNWEAIARGKIGRRECVLLKRTNDAIGDGETAGAVEGNGGI